MFLPPEALSVQADIPGSITLLNLIEAGCCSWAEIARNRDRERAIMRS